MLNSVDILPLVLMSLTFRLPMLNTGTGFRLANCGRVCSFTVTLEYMVIPLAQQRSSTIELEYNGFV